jgi:hypothetical protein
VAPGLVRGTLVAIALVVGAWLVQGVHALDLEAQWESTVQQAARGELTTAELERTRDALRGARRFSADQGPLINEGLLLHAVGRVPEARTIARRVVEKEPENFQAWFLMYLSTQEDRRRRDQAQRRLRELNPWAADVLR